MRPFTVISYCTPDFRCFAPGLRADCQRLGYPIHLEEMGEPFADVIQAFDFKIEYIRDMVNRYGQILWLDVECRIVKRLPEDWQSPLISTYQHGGHRGFSSGVLMLDRSQLELIDLWLKYARHYPKYPDDFVLDFLAQSIAMDFRTIPFALYDRDAASPIARGLWKNEHTVVQHPTINRWPEPLKYRRAFNGNTGSRPHKEAVARQRKTIFYRNFAGDFDAVDAIMRDGDKRHHRDAGWVFDAVDWTYAPELYWPECADDYAVKPRSFQKSRDYYNQPPQTVPFRQVAIGSMRLDAEDSNRYGLEHPPNVRERIYQFFQRAGLAPSSGRRAGDRL